MKEVTILILIDGFLQSSSVKIMSHKKNVTILILIDGFLQLRNSDGLKNNNKRHNPYFNRWFSAIMGFGYCVFLGRMSQSLF